MTESTSHEERQWAMWANLGGLLTLSNVPLANLAGAMVVYFNTRTAATGFAHEHARRALNFQMTYSLVFFIFSFGWVGWWIATVFAFSLAAPSPHYLPPGMVGAFAGFFGAVAFMLLLILVNCVLSVLGAVAASNGRHFNYPAIPFVR